jgi:hypothetical protein
MNEKERLMGISREILQISQDLVNLSPVSVAEIGKDFFPQTPGIYLWRTKDKNQIVYVGVGLGKKGLRERVAKQHLYPSYNKSVFRIKVSKEFGLDIGNECVKFISDNYNLSFLSFPIEMSAKVKAAESLIISTFEPKYNDK